jgi:nicotinamide mononucleotide transporter
MSRFEIIAALISLVAIILVVRRSVWNYPFGLAGVLMYAEIFHSAKLYSDMLLQGYFFAMQCYGWWNWLKHRDTQGLAVVEILTPPLHVLAWATAGSVALLLGFYMSRNTDAALPWWDASIAGLSVVAQILMSHRKLENWLFWIATNIIAVGVYFSKALYPTTILYAILLVLAVLGWREWRKQRKAELLTTAARSSFS